MARRLEAAGCAVSVDDGGKCTAGDGEESSEWDCKTFKRGPAPAGSPYGESANAETNDSAYRASFDSGTLTMVSGVVEGGYRGVDRVHTCNVAVPLLL